MAQPEQHPDPIDELSALRSLAAYQRDSLQKVFAAVQPYVEVPIEVAIPNVTVGNGNPQSIQVTVEMKSDGIHVNIYSRAAPKDQLPGHARSVKPGEDEVFRFSE